MTTKREDRELPVKINDAQAEERAGELAGLIVERTAIETDLAAYGADKRRRLREIKKGEKRLASAIQEGTELAMVQCEVRNDFSTNAVVVMRLDTKEIVERRAMTGDERQVEIDLGTGKGKKRRLQAVADVDPSEAH